MKLTSRQDIEAPIEVVFQHLTDFDQFERMAMRRGAEVEHLRGAQGYGVGMGWKLRFAFRGKVRRMEVRLESLTNPSPIAFSYDSPMFVGGAEFELLALAPRRTRLTMTVAAKPKTLTARLLIQSLRLAKGRTQRKLDNALGQLGNYITNSARRMR